MYQFKQRIKENIIAAIVIIIIASIIYFITHFNEILQQIAK